MKKRNLALFALLFAPIALFAQVEYTINGKIESLKGVSAKAYLTPLNKTSYATTDSVELKDGIFKFTGVVNDTTEATLVVKREKSSSEDFTKIYLVNGVINIEAPESISKPKFPNSKINEDYTRLEELSKPISTNINALMKEYESFTDAQRYDDAVMQAFTAKLRGYQKELNPILEKFGKENKQSYIGLLAYEKALGEDFNYTSAEAEFLKFDAALRASKLGQKIAKKLKEGKETSIGIMADFTQNDMDGKPVKLADFKGKYVLVDFWASWCGPCRAENPNVVEAYNKYKDKNFTIIGVSLDEKKDAWLKAIKNDGLTWPQVSDLKGWNNEVAQKYGIRAVPFNFLVDPSGKIIAKNLRAEGLEEKLAEVLGGKGK